jgi:hypothetical protein
LPWQTSHVFAQNSAAIAFSPATFELQKPSCLTSAQSLIALVGAGDIFANLAASPSKSSLQMAGPSSGMASLRSGGVSANSIEF